VTLLEREPDLGGQLRLAGDAPAHAETWRRFRAMAWRDLEAAAVTVRLDTEATADDADGYDAVIVATGARPYAPDVPTPARVAVRSAWDVLRAPDAVSGPVLVADWGGGWDGLDAAEVLAGAGVEVTLACAAAEVGGTLHQYQRNGYLDRLDRAGVRILHHHEVGGEPLALRHAFSGRTTPLEELATLVLAHGRAPEDGLWASLEGRAGCVRVGDVLGPRTLEEAYLEGFLAGRAAPG
jgi:NADPH-dependent 2,4-dienoyl-CoA reductase/sulfur reductase-like enzyme